jgi:hypothetical protein
MSFGEGMGLSVSYFRRLPDLVDGSNGEILVGSETPWAGTLNVDDWTMLG